MKTLKLQGIEFRISSFSNVDPVPFCVAVGQTQDGSVVVRHSQDPDPAKALIFTKEEWKAFVKGVKANEFDF
jgi:hypothetical protein